MDSTASENDTLMQCTPQSVVNNAEDHTVNSLLKKSEQVENGTFDEVSESAARKTSTEDPAANFEKAIAETKLGYFNLILFLVTIPSVFAAQFEVASLSYAFPAAQCDLNLSLEDRGLVNAVIYIGMIGSCFVWGSLADVFGRRKILIIAHLIDFFFVIMATLSPNLPVLLVAKLLGGFLINGPSMVLTPYLSEFHGTEYRSRVPLTIGVVYNLANIFLPLLAWATLSLNKFQIFSFEFHGWNLFLLISSIPTLLSAVIFKVMPESPKYLMSKGNNIEALQIFQKIFKFNTKRPKDEYPITTLTDEKQIHQTRFTIKEFWKQLSPLFSLKYSTKLALVCLLQFTLMMCFNSLRLWLPQIFQLINDYEEDSSKTVSFCNVLETIRSVADTSTENCTMNFDNSSVYINSMIVALTSIVACLTAGLCVNKVGKKQILIVMVLVCGGSVTAIYFTSKSAAPLTLICIYLMCMGVCIDVVITITVDLFPTYLRATALSMALMCGRIGSVVGNLTFPILLQIGCASVFFTLGSLTTGCVILCIFLPNTELKALQ